MRRPGTQIAESSRFRRCRTYEGRHEMMDLHPFQQRTFRQRASIDGVGLHSGAQVRVTLAPAPADSGIVFVRDGVEVPALAEFVIDTTMNTCLGRSGLRIGTVEHL